jgi:hypothetical protein
MKSALKTLLLVTALGVPTIAIGLLSPGPFAQRVLGGGIVLLVLGGAGAAYEALRGPKADRESDERADYILGRAMKFTFFTTAVAIQVYWSYTFSLTGNAGDTVFILVVVFWFSFLGAYAYNLLRA